jgi:hypothetical protein
MFLDEATDRERRGASWVGRVLLGMLVAIPLLVLYPAVADWLIPRFDITSVGSYVALLAVLSLVHWTSYRVLVALGRTGGTRGGD